MIGNIVINTYLVLLALMKSSGRRSTLKYQRKVSISPMKGNPMTPGGSLAPVGDCRILRGRTYQSSFHLHKSNPKNGKPPKTKAIHIPEEISISPL